MKKCEGASNSGQKFKINADFYKIIESDSGKNYACNFCEKTVPDKWQFSLHYYRFHKEKTLKCDNCEKHFGHTSLLKVHYERCSKNYRCDNCVKTFKKNFGIDSKSA